MHRFNVFKAFSGSSRDTSVSIERGSRPHANYGDEVRLGYHALAYGPSRRQVLTKRSRESGQRQGAQVFTPMPSQRTTVEDYDGSETAFSVGEEGPEAFDSVRAASPIPTVHREEQPSRLHEVFSDSSSGYATETRSDDESAFRQGPHTISYLQSEDGVLEDPAAQPIPIDPSTSTGDHTESVEGHYPEDIRPPSWQNFSDPLPSRGGLSASLMSSHALGYDRIQTQTYSNECYEEPRNIRHQSRTDETYYIIPNGTNVIFQDEDGNEITRVGDFGAGKSHRKTRRPAPFVVQDEYGRELYRTSDPESSSYSSRSSDPSHYKVQPSMMYVDPYDHGSHSRGQSGHSSYHRSSPTTYGRGREIAPKMETPRGPSSDQSYSSDRSYSSCTSFSPKYILIDRHGRQIPLSPTTSNRSGSHRSSRSGRSYR